MKTVAADRARVIPEDLLPRTVASSLKAISKQDAGFGGRIGRRIAVAVDDAVAIGESPEDIRGVATLSAEISTLLFELYGHRERFLRHAEILDATAREQTDWAVEQSLNMLTAFIDRQVALVREDIRNNHEWYTGFKDAGVAIKNVANQASDWIQAKHEGRESESSVPKDKAFLESVIEKHLGEAVVNRFMDSLEKDLSAQIQKRWEHAFAGACRDANDGFGRFSVRNAFGTTSVPSMEFDESSKVALIGLGGAATSTVVLAAGWHTLAWSMGGLFLPLAPIVIAASIGVAVLRKEVAQNKLIATLDAHHRSLTRAVRENVSYRVRLEFQKANAKTALNLRELIFQHHVGRFPSLQLDGLIRSLEDWLDELGAARSRVNVSAKDAGIDWLQKSREAMERKDDLSAALFAALAFEQLLHSINRKKKLGFDFRVPHHNRAFVDLLEQRSIVPAETISSLRAMKRQRDLFTHRLHDFAGMAPSKRRKMVKDMIEEIEKVMGK